MNFGKSDFSRLTGVGVIKWELETATPLCIKSGTISLWNQASSGRDKPIKLRRVDAEYDFFQKKTLPEDASISDFYYGTAIINNRLELRHEIPASGVRGALRNYTIKRLTPKKHWNAALFPEIDRHGELTDDAIKANREQNKKTYAKELKHALKTPGWKLVKNLFGLAVDTDDTDLGPETTRGRLSLETGNLPDISGETFKENIFDGNFKRFEPGPVNGKMVFTTRNPIDRITHGAKNQGLHSFTELAPGNRFQVTLRIINPRSLDLSLVALWEQGMEQGLLRLGGLNGAGRGRLKVAASNITLFLKKSKDFSGLCLSQKNRIEDLLAGLYTEFTIPDWQTEKKNYLRLLQTAFNDFKEGPEK